MPCVNPASAQLGPAERVDVHGGAGASARLSGYLEPRGSGLLGADGDSAAQLGRSRVCGRLNEREELVGYEHVCGAVADRREVVDGALDFQPDLAERVCERVEQLSEEDVLLGG
jgi:hypothetical protein